MAVLDEDFGTDLTPVEGNGGVRSCPVSVPERTPRDLRSLYERECARADRDRADAAEARAEELRWAEVASRSDAGSWKSRFKACRRRLSEAVEETKEARRAARDVPSLQGEVARLETLLCGAGIESNESTTVEALRKEVARLRKALVRAAPRRPTSCSPKPSSTRSSSATATAPTRGLVRLLGGLVILAFCWSHVRRDFIECAAGQVSLTQWCGGWIERIASLYRLNEARLEHYDPGGKRQTPAFDAAQGVLNEALDGLFAHAARELAGLADQALEGILAIVRRRLPQDWTERYHTTPVLIETFVETPRYTGAVYKASGWTHVGTTQGRGRYDRQKQYDKPKKDVWLRPLRKDWKTNSQSLKSTRPCGTIHARPRLERTLTVNLSYTVRATGNHSNIELN